MRRLAAMFNRDSNHKLSSCKVAFVFLLVASQGTAATRIWDTISPSLNEEVLADRSGWKVVPTETDRWKGPNYYSPERYGMHHSFRGDAVVENEHLVAVFSSRKAKAIIYSKADHTAKKVEVVPLELKARPATITHFGVLQNSGDEVALEVVFSGEGTGRPCRLYSPSARNVLSRLPLLRTSTG